MDVNERVIHIMNEEKLTQKEFAAILDVSQPTLTYIANGRNKVSLDIVQKIALQYPDINLRWLVLGEGKMRVESPSGNKGDLSKLMQELEIINSLNTKNLTSIILRLKKETNT